MDMWHVAAKDKILGLSVVVAVTGIVTLLGYRPVLETVGDYLIVQDQLRPADVIHVISGPDYRADYGIQLYHEGYGSKLFFTGGWCPVIQGNHAERGAELAIRNGVPEQDIVIDGTEVHSTYEEVVRLQTFIEWSTSPVRSVLIVSDPFHMRRARWAYHHVLGDSIDLQTAPVPFEASPYVHQWWTDKDSARYVRDEYVKSVYYLARYQLTRGRLRDWLATYDRD